MVPLIAILDNLGMSELMIVAVVALLLFGKRLPEVAQQAGATLAKFRKSLDSAVHDSGVEQEIRKIKSAMPTDLSVRDVARVAARKFEDRMRDEIDIPPISLDAPQSTPPANTSASAGGSEPSGGAQMSAQMRAALTNGAPLTPPSTPPKPGVDPASQFTRPSNGVHQDGVSGQADTASGGNNAAAPSSSEAGSIERAQQGGIQPRPLPPGSVPRE